MDQYFKITVKNHKVLNKKILFLEYLPEIFFPNETLLKELVSFYMSILTLNKEDGENKLIVIFDLRNIENYDKQKVWEGAGQLKQNDDFFVKNIEKVFVIIENQLAIDFLNILIKVLGTNIETTLVKNINEALNNLS